MTHINSDSWQLKAESVEQKRALLAFAKSCGVPTVHPLWGRHDDGDLYLNWWSEETGIAALPTRIQAVYPDGVREPRPTTLITPAEFEDMCRAYEPARVMAHFATAA